MYTKQVLSLFEGVCIDQIWILAFSLWSSPIDGTTGSQTKHPNIHTPLRSFVPQRKDSHCGVHALRLLLH